MTVLVDEEFCDVSSLLHDLLSRVVKRRGEQTYIDVRHIPAAYESKIFGNYEKYRVYYGIKQYIIKPTEVTHVRVDGMWYKMNKRSNIGNDFKAASMEIAAADNNIVLIDCPHELFSFSSVVGGIVHDGVEKYEYCYIVNKSNWKNIKSLILQCICEIC